MPARKSSVTNGLRLVTGSAPCQAQTDAAFLDFVGPLDGLHVLLIGTGQAELMCALARRNCAEACAIAANSRLRPRPAHLIVVTVRSAEQVAQSIGLAARAAVGGTTLLLRVPSDATALLVRQARGAAADAGFSVGRALRLGNEAVIMAEHGRRDVRQAG